MRAFSVTAFVHRTLLVALLVASTGGCKPDLIPGTKLEDTAENRAVFDFMEDYRKAMEARSAEAVLALVAEDFFEDNGNSNQDDDYGIEKLRTELARNFEHTAVIQLRLELQHVEPAKDENNTHVYYRYLQRALLKLPSGSRWVSQSDVNRIVLRRKGDSHEDGFLIVAGL
jgi:hypothetical protein